jgi:hypothetical protein
MIDPILAYAGVSYPALLLAAAAYILFREVGAAAVAAIGQYLANVGPSSWGASTLHSAPTCVDVLHVVAALPLVLFAVVPAARSELSYRRREGSSTSDALSFWPLFFLASAANHATIALVGIPDASQAAGGALLLALLSGAAAIVVSTRDISLAVEPVQSKPTTAGRPAFVQAQAAPPVTGPRSVPIQHEAEPTEAGHPQPATAREAEVLPFVRRKAGESSPPETSTTYLFNKNEFFIFRQEHLQVLEDLLRREPPGVLKGLQSSICARLGRRLIQGDERAFVQAYVSQFRLRLEACYPGTSVPLRMALAA